MPLMREVAIINGIFQGRALYWSQELKEVWEDIKISWEECSRKGKQEVQRPRGRGLTSVFGSCESHSQEVRVAGMEGALRDEKETQSGQRRQGLVSLRKNFGFYFEQDRILWNFATGRVTRSNVRFNSILLAAVLRVKSPEQAEKQQAGTIGSISDHHQTDRQNPPSFSHLSPVWPTANVMGTWKDFLSVSE